MPWLWSANWGIEFVATMTLAVGHTSTEDLFFRRWAGAHAKLLSAEQNMNNYRRLLNNAPVLLNSVAGVGCFPGTPRTW